jgi:hypothetical protein
LRFAPKSTNLLFPTDYGFLHTFPEQSPKRLQLTFLDIRHQHEAHGAVRFYYEIIVSEPASPVIYTPEELYFGPLLLQARSPAYVGKWQRLLL